MGRFTGAYRGTDAEGKVVAQFHADSGNIDPTKPIYPRITTARDDDSAEPHRQELQIQVGSDASVVDEYGAIADVPNKLFAAIGQMFETAKPDPQDVADAVVNLINLPKGQRPLRTVVDTPTGDITKRANDAVKVEYEKVLRAFGMDDLLA
ncbi:hypothetical protein KK062_12860 [Fulvivirgaceae bacterium PWU5]|uniref:Uncharacterized protein n=1 Tax=Dawidia cretensis TaxID=2782350 RepID=A0AAP2GUL4_9BACT|nr:hypothetical protein [Dawidia cretensis]MBT1709125.1 hypothetical protein [Dawidia cretensis]